jgi:hypothetical protein
MNNEIEREITALREQLAAVSKEHDAMLPDYELKQAMRKNYDAAKKHEISYIRWNVEDIYASIAATKEQVK